MATIILGAVKNFKGSTFPNVLRGYVPGFRIHSGEKLKAS